MGWQLRRDSAVADIDLLDPPVADTTSPNPTVTVSVGLSGTPRDVFLAIRRLIAIAWPGATLVRRDNSGEWSLTTYGLISWRVAELVLTHRAALAVLELTLRGYDTDCSVKATWVRMTGTKEMPLVTRAPGRAAAGTTTVGMTGAETTAVVRDDRTPTP